MSRIRGMLVGLQQRFHFGWEPKQHTPGVREIGGFIVVIAVVLSWRLYATSKQADARSPDKDAVTNGEVNREPVMAMVNGVEITREDLVRAAVSRYGQTILEALVNRTIIEQACQRHQISVSPEDVQSEITAMAQRFNVPREQWIELIQKERGIEPQQYAEDIVWPMLALRHLARASIEPSDTELEKAFENRFGAAIKARIIVLPTQKTAEKIRALAIAAPDDFGGLARQHSIDVGSASANGWVQPIRRHSGDTTFEKAAFELEEGMISDVVQVADQFIFLKCEGKLPAADVTLAEVRPRLMEELREEKSRRASKEVFRKEQDAAIIQNIMNDPVKRSEQPGVAALVNGVAIMISTVEDECVDRHGEEVLEILITRSIVNQALQRQRKKVTQSDIDAEIIRAAESLGFRKSDGSADTAAWLERVAKEEKASLDYYIEDIVWPTVALKKLLGPVPVTREDLDRAFEATFGARSRCRMIVLDTQRRAQEVWQLARQNLTVEMIGDLAERYSVDPTSRTLRGEVPPIQRYGGQPTLEREAFSLQTGELSGVIQVADRFLVLYCEGYTKPADVSFDEVKAELHADILEKKQRIEMARHFTHLRGGAAIDNYLAGTSQSPVGQHNTPRSQGQALPPSTLTQAEIDELTRPRAGSRKAKDQDAGVVPASREVSVP